MIDPDPYRDPAAEIEAAEIRSWQLVIARRRCELAAGTWSQDREFTYQFLLATRRANGWAEVAGEMDDPVSP